MIACRKRSDGVTLYVESIDTKGKGDKYSYTTNYDKAMYLTEWQAKCFVKYMKECATQGFYY